MTPFPALLGKDEFELLDDDGSNSSARNDAPWICDWPDDEEWLCCVSLVSKVGHSSAMLSSFARGLCYCQTSSLCVRGGPQRKAPGSPSLYHWHNVDLLEVMIQEARRAIVVKGSSEVMLEEELFEGLEKVMQRA